MGVGRFPADRRDGLVRLLESVRTELLPLPGALTAAERLLEGATVAVTADPGRSMVDTVDLAVDLARRGFQVIPHLSAQLITDTRHLATVLERLTGADIASALVVGGVADRPGEFLTALDLLDAIDRLGAPFERIGIAAYPEGHHVIPDDAIHAALLAKTPRADWITTQICLDVARLQRWIERIRAEGVSLPVWIGVPAVADLTGLLSFGLRVGAGRSLQFAFEHPRLVSRLLRPGGRAATRHVEELTELAVDDSLGIAGLHVFTYNQVRAAERWRTRLLRTAALR